MNFCVAQTGAGGVTQRLSVVRVQQNFLESLYTSMAATLPAYFSCMHVLSLVRRERRRSFQHNAWLGRLVVNTTFSFGTVSMSYRTPRASVRGGVQRYSSHSTVVT